MLDGYTEAFDLVLAEARTIAGISDLERTDLYEPLKAKIYDLLKEGRTDLHEVTEEALSWLRQQVQIRQSKERLNEN